MDYLILLTDLLTPDLDSPGCSWIRQPSAAPASRPFRRLRTGLDNPNLATDKTSVWDLAWPLLLFMLLPLALGCAFRLWWPDLTPPLGQWVVRIAILCLLLNLNFTLFVYWHLFVQTWGTGSYIAALAGPFIGLGCGYLLVTSLRVKDVGIRHATEITTAIRNIYVGNAEADAAGNRGWLLRHCKPADDPRHSEDVEIKWPYILAVTNAPNGSLARSALRCSC